jgi:hypothetical protein
MKDVENVKDRKFDFLSSGPFELSPPFLSSLVSATKSYWRSGRHGDILWDRGEDVLNLRRRGHGGKRSRRDGVSTVCTTFM